MLIIIVAANIKSSGIKDYY